MTKFLSLPLRYDEFGDEHVTLDDLDDFVGALKDVTAFLPEEHPREYAQGNAWFFDQYPANRVLCWLLLNHLQPNIENDVLRFR